MKNLNLVNQDLRRYTVTYPALPALSSGADDNPAPVVEMGSPVDIDHVSAANYQYLSRAALKYHGQATAIEVLYAQMRKDSLSVDTYRSLLLPIGEATILQLLTNTQQDFQESLQPPHNILLIGFGYLNARIDELIGHFDTFKDHLKERFDAWEERMDRLQETGNYIAALSAKNVNRQIGFGEAITPIPNKYGGMPDASRFPRTKQDLMNMDDQNTDYLLEFYSISPQPGATLDQRKNSLIDHLGLVKE